MEFVVALISISKKRYGVFLKIQKQKNKQIKGNNFPSRPFFHVNYISLLDMNLLLQYQLKGITNSHLNGLAR